MRLTHNYEMRFPWITARLERSGLGIERATLIVSSHSRSGETAFLRALDLLYSWDVPLGATYALRDPARLPETVQAPWLIHRVA
jgi:hypothetical protein